MSQREGGTTYLPTTTSTPHSHPFTYLPSPIATPFARPPCRSRARTGRPPRTPSSSLRRRPCSPPTPTSSTTRPCQPVSFLPLVLLHELIFSFFRDLPLGPRSVTNSIQTVGCASAPPQRREAARAFPTSVLKVKRQGGSPIPCQPYNPQFPGNCKQYNPQTDNCCLSNPSEYGGGSTNAYWSVPHRQSIESESIAKRADSFRS